MKQQDFNIFSVYNITPMRDNNEERRSVGIDRSELHPIKKEEMSSKFRRIFGPLLCIFGIHNWGPPKAKKSVVLKGERNDDGDWEHWTKDPSKIVSQSCQSCNKYKDREDLNWETLSMIQRGEYEDNSGR